MAMLRSLDIHGFRGLEELHLSGLGRVNLLVGGNNSGKTTVLEAVQVVATGGDIAALLAGLRRRDERAPGFVEEAPMVAFDARHLFHGRSLDRHIRFEATAEGGRRMTYTIAAPPVDVTDEEGRAHWQRAVQVEQRLIGRVSRQTSLFDVEIDPGDRVPRILVVEEGGNVIGQAALVQGASHMEREQLFRSARTAGPVQFVGTQSLTQYQLARLLDRAVLADELPSAVTAMNTVEEGITRLAAVEDLRSRRIVVGLHSASEPVPLGCMGEGMSRMLALALSLSAARDGFLLVDEIDTGLHYSVMAKMWRLVFETALRLNVCVYATTHSHDCVRALAEIANPQVRGDGEVALLRVERGAPQAVHFSEREISLLDARGVEPR